MRGRAWYCGGTARQVLETSGRDLVLSCPDVIENLMGLVWSKDLKTLRYTTGAIPLRPLSCSPLKECVCADRCAVRCFVCVLVAPVGMGLPHSSGGLNKGLCVAGALRNLSVEAAGAEPLKKYQGALQALWELKKSSDATTARYSAALLKNLAVRSTSPASPSRVLPQ